MLGETISHYRILRKLGEGGMGIVYEAEDTRLQRVVALKFLARELTRDHDARARFVQEARAASALDHTNICAIHEIDETPDGLIFIVMARYEGATIDASLTRGPLPLEEALETTEQIATGLAAMHARGVVHRDLKPRNVFRTRGGVVKILDFGLAKLVGATRITREGTTVGTVAYMSPEQATGAPVDHRTDVWALGVMLYEMATGRTPFLGEHPQAVIRSILHDAPEPITRARTRPPAELERIVTKALAKRPDERYQHLEEMLGDVRGLRRWLESGSKTVERLEALTAAPASNGKRPFSRALRAGAAVMGLAFVGLSALVLLRRAPPDPTGRAIRSVAVLPLANLMQDPDQDYFVDGMHEALIASLSRVRALRVISRTSTMRYRDTEKNMADIARELDVDALVEGSVLRVDDRVRITAQLIHGPSDRNLWGESYDREVRDALTLVSEVAREIAVEIEIVLSPEEEMGFTENPSANLDAQEAYLKGRHAFNRLGSGVGDAVPLFDEAIALDPGFAPPHAGKAIAFFTLGLFGREPWAEMVSKARASAKRALELDDGLGEAHTAMGWIQLYSDWDWPGAEAEFLRALELNPSDALARHGYGDFLTVAGRAGEAVRQVMLGRQADPIAVAAAAPVPAHLMIAGRNDEAMEACRELVEAHPGMADSCRWIESDAQWNAGRREQALAALRDVWEDDAPLLAALEEGRGQGGPTAGMRAAAELLVERAKTTSVSPNRIATLFAKSEDVARTLEWLERALQYRHPETLHTLFNPSFGFLHSHAEFQRLRGELGLPEG